MTTLKTIFLVAAGMIAGYLLKGEQPTPTDQFKLEFREEITARWRMYFGPIDTQEKQCARDYVLYGETEECHPITVVNPDMECCRIEINHATQIVSYFSELGIDAQRYSTPDEMESIINEGMEHCYHRHQTEY